MTTSTQTATTSTARLDIDGLHNARDLGGFSTPHGVTRRRVVVRSESPARITPAGLRQLAEHGVAGYLDLRSDEEAEEEPSPFASGRSYRRVPILDRDGMVRVSGLNQSGELLRFILFKRAEVVGEALLNLLDLAAGGGVLVHCRAGKDRAGVVAALLLSNAGVEPEVVAADHARSQANLEPLFGFWARRSGMGEERALAAFRKFPPTAESMLLALSEIGARHGGVPQYLRHIGLTDDEIVALRLLLVLPPGAGRAAA